MNVLPSLEHLLQAIITSAIVFIALYPFRKALGFAEKEVTAEYRKKRKEAVKSHIRNGHVDKLKVCRTDTCVLLSAVDASLATEHF